MSVELQNEALEKGKDLDFKEFYEKSMDNTFQSMLAKKRIRKEEFDYIKKMVSEKRKAGIKKYGNSAFQNSFETAVSTDTDKHLEEELLDAINYCLHGFFVYSNKGELKKARLYEDVFLMTVSTLKLFQDEKDFKGIGNENFK